MAPPKSIMYKGAKYVRVEAAGLWDDEDNSPEMKAKLKAAADHLEKYYAAIEKAKKEIRGMEEHATKTNLHLGHHRALQEVRYKFNDWYRDGNNPFDSRYSYEKMGKKLIQTLRDASK